MAEKEKRPYFKSSISQLETLFEQLKTNPDSLKVLNYELSFRTTNRAAKLRLRIAEVLAAVAAVAERATPSTELGRKANSAQEQSEPSMSAAVPPPLAVHRAFIDASAQKVLHNLSVLWTFSPADHRRMMRSANYLVNSGRPCSWSYRFSPPPLHPSNACLAISRPAAALDRPRRSAAIRCPRRRSAPSCGRNDRSSLVIPCNYLESFLCHFLLDRICIT
jgi:hypothetical protein